MLTLLDRKRERIRERVTVNFLPGKGARPMTTLASLSNSMKSSPSSWAISPSRYSSLLITEDCGRKILICCASGAALTPGCRSRHARQRPLRRLPGRACLPVSGALLFGSLSWLLLAKCGVPRTMHATRAACPTLWESWKGSDAYADE